MNGIHESPSLPATIIATRDDARFRNHFSFRLRGDVHIFDQGAPALRALHALGARRLVCDAAPLRDGMSGYRIAARLRKDGLLGTKVQVYMMVESMPPAGHSAAQALGVTCVISRSPERVRSVIDPPVLHDTVSARSTARAEKQRARCDAALRELMGPIASKLIESVCRSASFPECGIEHYISSLESLIALPDVKLAFKRAMEQARY